MINQIKMTGFQAVFALCLLLQVYILPDSPRWLLAHGRINEAKEVLARLDNDPIDSIEVTKKVDDIMSAIKLESEGGRCAL